MALSEQEMADALSERQHAEKVLDRFGGLRTYYRDWQDDIETLKSVYNDDWSMIWPDGSTERVDPAVPNMVRIAIKDRARGVAATPPQLKCRPENEGDEAREKANKLERITASWLDKNDIQGFNTQMWAMDFMGTGLVACKVLPDFSQPSKTRYPVFSRMDPAFSYPDPIFTPGPFCDSFIYAYEDYRRAVEGQYGVTLDWPRPREPKEASMEKVRVIEYYDTTNAQVVIESLNSNNRGDKMKAMIVSEAHGLSHCPVVVKAAANLDGTYSGEFSSGLGVLAYWDKLMRMVMDDAIKKVYPERLAYNVQNPEDYGPDATIALESPDGRYEYVQSPNQPFSNFQIMREVSGSVRTSFMLPVSRSGDPNESIISAAGISATQGQHTEDIRSIQRDALGPLVEAGMELALEGEVIWSPDATKQIATNSGGETYVPRKDIGGYRKIMVRYGPMSGLDEINQGVMVLQQLGGGIISKRDAMELSPFTEDPQRTEKRQLQEAMQQALVAGLLQQAAQGTISPFHLAMISQAVESDEVTLSEAIAALVPQQLPPPVGSAPGQGSAPGAPPQAPGIPGAAVGPQPQTVQAGA